jgi:hypothetical protein
VTVVLLLPYLAVASASVDYGDDKLTEHSGSDVGTGVEVRYQ